MNKNPALIRNLVAGSGAGVGVGTGVIALTIRSVSSAQDELKPNVNPPPNVILVAMNISPAFSGSVHGLTSTAPLIVMPPRGTPEDSLRLLESMAGNRCRTMLDRLKPVRSMLTKTIWLKKTGDGSVLVSVQIAETCPPH